METIAPRRTRYSTVFAGAGDEAVQTSPLCYLSSCRKTNLRARKQCLRSCSALYSARANATPKRRDC